LFGACADLAPHGRKVELYRPRVQREGRPPRGERHPWDEATRQLVGAERPTQRHRFDDPGAGPSHAPPAAAGGELEDLYRNFEAVLREVPEGMWTRIQDEGFLEQCIGLPTPWRGLVR
jgi:hypothetical protein